MQQKNNATPNEKIIQYVLDTNVLIHDPNAILNFDEHCVSIPMTVLEELDKLKSGKHSVAAECRQAIRLIEKILGDSPAELIKAGVPIARGKSKPNGYLSIITAQNIGDKEKYINDDLIIKAVIESKQLNQYSESILVTKDINMRLKAKALGITTEDYSTDQLIDDISLLPSGYHEIDDFWALTESVDTTHGEGFTSHKVKLKEPMKNLNPNDFILSQDNFIGLARSIDGLNVIIEQYSYGLLMKQEAWGLSPRDIYQALAMFALLDPDIHLVNLCGAAGSGKTILALAAAIEQTMATKIYNKIIVTRSVQGLDEDIGFLPGTEAEKMEPWLGAITDNLEALHKDDEDGTGSVDYILQKVPIQFKSLNFMRGRSFQDSFVLVDECQNLTPHQIKTIITRAGQGTKVVCLGNLSQIDTPYLSATSSGLTYLAERFKGFNRGMGITLQGVPRSALAEYAEKHL